MRQIAFALMLAGLLAGCVRTQMSTYRDPNYSSGYRLGKVLVVAAELPLAERQSVESRFVEELGKVRIQAVRGMDLLPITRHHTTEQIQEVLASNSIDSVLMMVGYTKSTDTSYVPPTYHSGQTSGTVSYVGNTAYLQTYTSPGYTTGGYSVRKPRFSYKINLHDTQTGGIVWTASAEAQGNAFTNPEDFGKSSAAATITKFVEEGLVARPR